MNSDTLPTYRMIWASLVRLLGKNPLSCVGGLGKTGWALFDYYRPNCRRSLGDGGIGGSGGNKSNILAGYSFDSKLNRQ